MPSPVGHVIAGLCGFMVMRKQAVSRPWTLLLVSMFIANLPDLDILPGLLLGDPRAFHHQGMHSVVAAVGVGVAVALLVGRWKCDQIGWGIWGGGLYLSHVLLDLLVDDPSPPFGAQLLWPFSQMYFISPVTLFARFDYFDPAAGVVRTLFTVHNLGTVLREVLLMAPFVGMAWYVGKNSRGRHREQ